MNEIPIVLASSSPRRKELLEGLRLRFVTDPSQEDESVPEGTPPADIVDMLSLRKARSVAAKYGQGLVIGSDTIVVLRGEVLGKPADEQDAVRMLSLLQGREHLVYSGISIVDAGTGRSETSRSVTAVKMRPMDEERILRYVRTGEPMDKAGSYGIQGLGGVLVEKIDGDYYTVMGLPTGLLAEMLERFGVRIL